MIFIRVHVDWEVKYRMTIIYSFSSHTRRSTWGCHLFGCARRAARVRMRETLATGCSWKCTWIEREPSTDVDVSQGSSHSRIGPVAEQIFEVSPFYNDDERKRERESRRRISVFLLIRKTNALLGIPHRSSLVPKKNEKFHEDSITIFHSTSLSWHRWLRIAFNRKKMTLHPSFQVADAGQRKRVDREKAYLTRFELT